MRLFPYYHNIPQQLQTQVSLMDQLEELVMTANRLGLYDAADFLALRMRDKEKTEGK